MIFFYFGYNQAFFLHEHDHARAPLSNLTTLMWILVPWHDHGLIFMFEDTYFGWFYNAKSTNCYKILQSLQSLQSQDISWLISTKSTKSRHFWFISTKSTQFLQNLQKQDIFWLISTKFTNQDNFYKIFKVMTYSD